MALVEGFGDEVLCMGAVLGLLLTAVIVWASTSVTERPRSAVIFTRRVTEAGSPLLDNSVIDAVLPPGIPGSSSGYPGTTDPPDGGSERSSRDAGGDDDGAGSEHGISSGGIGPDTIETEEEIRSKIDAIKIKLKYVNDSDKSVDGRLGEKLIDFKRRIFRPDLAAGKFVRLIFQGRLLSNDDETLAQLGLFDNCVVHCHVSNNHPRSSSAASQSNNTTGMNAAGFDLGNHPAFHHFNDAALLAQGEFEIELGNWMMPVAGFLLSILWSYWYQFGHFFSFLATVCLTVLTGLFFTVLLGIYSNVWSTQPAATTTAPLNGADADGQDERGRSAPIVSAIWNLMVPLPGFVRNLVGGDTPPPPSTTASN